MSRSIVVAATAWMAVCVVVSGIGSASAEAQDKVPLPQSCTELTAKLFQAKSADTGIGQAIDKAYKSAGVHPVEARPETPLLRGGKSARLLIDKNLEADLYTFAVVRGESEQVEQLSARSVSVAGKTPVEKRIEIAVPVSASSGAGFGKADYRIVACLREASADRNLPPIFIAAASATVSSFHFSLVVALLLTGLLYVGCGRAAASGDASRRLFLNPLKIAAGVSGQASLSNLQIFAFTMLVFGLLVFVLLRTGVVSDVSETVAWLLGIVGIGSVGAKLAVPRRERLSAGNVQWLRERGWLPLRPRLGDLIMDGEQLAVDRLQGLAFGIVVFVALLLQGGYQLATFSVPENILLVLAASQGIYLAGSVARNVGTQPQPAPGAAPPPPEPSLDDVVSEARVAWPKLQAKVAEAEANAEETKRKEELKKAAESDDGTKVKTAAERIKKVFGVAFTYEP